MAGIRRPELGGRLEMDRFQMGIFRGRSGQDLVIYMLLSLAKAVRRGFAPSDAVSYL